MLFHCMAISAEIPVALVTEIDDGGVHGLLGRVQVRTKSAMPPS